MPDDNLPHLRISLACTTCIAQALCSREIFYHIFVHLASVFSKKRRFSFLFALFHLPGDFLCRMHNRVAVFSVENLAQGIECPFSGRFILKISPSGGGRRRTGSSKCSCLFEKSRHADAQRLKSGHFFAFAFSSSRSFSLGVTYTVVYTS